jgi:starch synthase
MRCLFAVSEVAGFAKTGGLADVAASLPRALSERGVSCAVILPLYGSARRGLATQQPLPLEPTGLTFSVPMGQKLVRGALWRSSLPSRQAQGTPIPVFLVEQADYFERDNPDLGRGLYQFTKATGQKIDYADNCERYGFFCRAVLEAIRLLDFWPDVLHINDWQTGLVPVYLREIYPQQAPSACRARYAGIKTLCTIHNLAYQGNFWHLDMPLLGLPWRLFNFEQLEFYNHINFLKAGIVFSDLLTTVSPTYAREIQTPYFGCGLQGVLLGREGKLHGIVNGADYEVWNPKTDAHLASTYDEQTLGGKAACKAALQKKYGFEENPRTPLLGMVSRLVDQKGFDLIARSAWDLMREGVQLVVLGEGNPAYHEMLGRLRQDFPRKVGVSITQDEKLAHEIEAGADMFLMPSQYEPCGLNQLYSLKYGAVPIVRATGGLADTVVDATSANRALGTATGFTFVVYAPPAFLDAVKRALSMYRDLPEEWLALQRAGMRQDWSWDRSAAQYEKLYRSLVKEEGDRR